MDLLDVVKFKKKYKIFIWVDFKIEHYMVDPLALNLLKVVNKPLNDLYDFIKKETKFHLEKQKLNEISGKLDNKVENIKKVKTIYKGDEAIDLNLFYYPPYINNDKGYIKSENIRPLAKVKITSI